LPDATIFLPAIRLDADKGDYVMKNPKVQWQVPIVHREAIDLQKRKPNLYN
jgi:hypothetical protein